MKKSKLDASSLQKGEVLTRSQLKEVLGGKAPICHEWVSAEPGICFNCCLNSLPGSYEGCALYCGV